MRLKSARSPTIETPQLASTDLPAHRISNHLKLVRGTFRPSRAHQESVHFEPLLAAPEPPEWLDVRASAFWQSILPGLIRRRVISDADLGGLAVMCNLHSRIRRMVEANGDVSPAHLNALRGWLTEFGMTPASRDKASVLATAGVLNAFTKNRRPQAAEMPAHE